MIHTVLSGEEGDIPRPYDVVSYGLEDGASMHQSLYYTLIPPLRLSGFLFV